MSVSKCFFFIFLVLVRYETREMETISHEELLMMKV